MIAPTTVATAAHCLWLKRPQNWIRPKSLHVLVGYDRGKFRQHLRVTSYRIAKSYDPRAKPGSADGAGDWALLTVHTPFDGLPLPLARRDPKAGAVLSLAGYAATRLHRLTRHAVCRVARVAAARFLHGCAAVRGLSGAPLFAWSGGRRVAFGLHSASSKSQGLAVSATAIRNDAARKPY